MTPMRNSEGYFDPTAGIAMQNIERSEKMMNDIRRGDIFYIEKYNTVGSEQQAGRPALVVSNDMNNEYSETVEIVYLTTQPKTDLPTHVTIRSTSRQSTALCEQITTVSKMKVGSFMCSVSAEEMALVDIALLTSLCLDMGRSGAPAASHEAPEPTPTKEPEPCLDAGHIVPVQDVSHVVDLERENVKLSAQLELYKGLYAEMCERAMGRAVGA